MFSKNSRRAFKSNAFRALVVSFSSVALVTTLSACSSLSAITSIYEGEAFPQMPAPEVATYVLDLSGSTYPKAQLEALGSGINGFLAGESLGNPFAQTPVAPRGLSIQFVTKNSAQAPRILLVSTKPSQSLYDYTKRNTPNLEGAIQLWDGLTNARTLIWKNSALEGSQTDCTNKVVELLGRQQLSREYLKIPAGIICQDAKQTGTSLKRLNDFVETPGIEMGSDVKGAIDTSLQNLAIVKAENPSAQLSLVIASDLVDEVSLSLNRRLIGIDAKSVCNMATKDAGNAGNDYSSVNVVIVGAGNSKINTKTLAQVQAYWTCYLNQIGINDIRQQSDLSGF